MYLHPPAHLRLGHNRTVDWSLRDFFFFNKPLLVHFEKLWSPPPFLFFVFFYVFFFNLRASFKTLGSHNNTKATTTPPFCHGMLGLHHRAGRRASRLRWMQWNKKEKGGEKKEIWANVHGLRGSRWGETRKLDSNVNRPKEEKKRKKIILKNCTCKHHTFTESKTRGENTKLHTVYSTSPCTELQSFISAGEATIKII